MASNTPSYSFLLPTVGGDTDLWGTYLNQNWTDLDGLLDGTTPIVGVDIDTADIDADNLVARGGSLSGMTINSSEVNATKLKIDNRIEEGVQAVSGQTPTINPDNGGTVVTWTLTAGVSHTPAIVMEAGEYVTLMITASTGTITWSGVTWLNETPTLVASKVNVVELWKVGATTYGSFAGATA